MAMFQFNMGGGTGVEPELEKICREHIQCKDCPMINGQIINFEQIKTQVVCENSRINSGSK